MVAFLGLEFLKTLEITVYVGRSVRGFGVLQAKVSGVVWV